MAEKTSRREAYERKSAELSKRCEKCIFPHTPERCDECTTGRKARMLEVEYADVTGCSHTNWKKQ